MAKKTQEFTSSSVDVSEQDFNKQQTTTLSSYL